MREEFCTLAYIIGHHFGGGRVHGQGSAASGQGEGKLSRPSAREKYRKNYAASTYLANVLATWLDMGHPRSH